jgi:hypothetical protein
MPSLAIYMYWADCDAVLDLLNSDEEIAFIIATRPNYWQAFRRLDKLPIQKVSLWHIPSGPLPVKAADGEPVLIKDPWTGWAGVSVRGDLDSPMLIGGGQPGVVRFTANHNADGPLDVLRVSYLEWYGNSENARLGWPVSPATERWWNRFRKKVKSMASDVPAGGLSSESGERVLALPCALEALQRGIKAEVRSIRYSGRTEW